MKGFKSTGKGPRYGNFNFSTRTGYSASSGKVSLVRGYTRIKRAAGGAVTAPQAQTIARKEIAKHVASPRPRGHGIRR